MNYCIHLPLVQLNKFDTRADDLKHSDAFKNICITSCKLFGNLFDIRRYASSKHQQKVNIKHSCTSAHSLFESPQNIIIVAMRIVIVCIFMLFKILYYNYKYFEVMQARLMH